MKTIEQLKLDSNFAIIEKDEQVSIITWKTVRIESLEELEKLQQKTRNKIAFIAPFCLARDEKWYEANGSEKIIAMEIESEIISTRESLLSMLPNNDVNMWRINTNISDDEYWIMVEQAKIDIWNGEYNQIILSRKFLSNIDLNIENILSIYSKLLKNRWQYMTYIFNTDNEIFVWASPEKHLLIEDSKVIMNPIAWTIKKWDFFDFYDRLTDFLIDEKEIWELSMVIDEELKMMSKISKSWNIDWPLIKEVWAVCHTETNLNWIIKDVYSMIDAFRETLYAPTLVWWPIESAFNYIKKYENDSRWYYWGAFGILWEDFLDTCIVIRTAFIDKINSILEVRAWAWIVKDSNSENETQETIAKSNWFFWALTRKNSLNSQKYMSSLDSDEMKNVNKLLESRKKQLSSFYTNSHLNENLEVQEIKDKNFILINNWDDFVYLTGFMIEKMWWKVKIINNWDFEMNKIKPDDIVLLWPWYGDINDENDEKMLKLLDVTKQLINNNNKLLWICLWHQSICKTMWFEIQKQEKITQWDQLEVTINWKIEKVWFYNSFSPVYKSSDKNIDLFQNNRILNYKDSHISSTQAHPESIMSTNWFEMLKNMILDIL